jgi:hypothetical protein
MLNSLLIDWAEEEELNSDCGSEEKSFYIFFSFLCVNWDLSSGFHDYKAGTLPLELYFQP